MLPRLDTYSKACRLQDLLRCARIVEDAGADVPFDDNLKHNGLSTLLEVADELADELSGEIEALEDRVKGRAA